VGNQITVVGDLQIIRRAVQVGKEIDDPKMNEVLFKKPVKI